MIQDKLKEGILGKIQKLRRKGESSYIIGSVEEAALFLQKAKKLLIENGLTEVDLLELEEKQDFLIIQSSTEERIKYGQCPDDGTWEVDLLNTICKNNFCHCIFFTLKKTSAILGRKEYIPVVKYLFQITRIVIKELSLISYRKELLSIREKYYLYGNSLEEAMMYGLTTFGLTETELKNNLSKGKDGKFHILDVQKAKLMTYRDTYIRSFLKGAVVGLNKKLSLENLKSKIEDKETYIKTEALELVNSDAIDEYIKKHWSSIGVIRNSLPSPDVSAYLERIRQGEKIETKKGLSNNFPPE